MKLYILCYYFYKLEMQNSLRMRWNMNIKRITPQKGLIIVGSFALVVVATLFAFQFYLSYVEVTGAANQCYDIGGYPIIEKTGLEMTYFECVTN